MKGAFVRLITIATVLLMLCIMEGRGGRAFAASTPTPGGTKIINAASASWGDNRGNTYQITSNEVVVTVQNVAAVTVTPKEPVANPATDGYPVGQNVTRTFLITNASNIADAYRITAFTADKGTVVSLAFVTPGGLVPITIGSTVSPTIQPGQNIPVQVVLATAGIAVGTQFALHLTAQTTVAGTANGLQSDSGEQWLVTATGPTFSGPGAPNTPINKTVNHVQLVQTQAGSIVQFDIVVKNWGGSPATNAVMTDTVPAGITPDMTTVKINGVAVGNATFAGGILTVPMGTFDAGATDDISFNSQVINVATLGTTFVNVAAVSADGIPAIPTTPAAVFIGTADVVYDPANNNAPVTGALVSLLDQNGHLVPLGGSSSGSATSSLRRSFASLPASSNTSNPYTTGSDGVYGFALQPSQIAPGGSTFYITIAAPGYLNRRIKMLVTPSAMSGLYNVQSTSDDNQPIAAAGAYSLTTSSVAMNNIFGLFGNLPMFRAQVLTINKQADKTSAQPGDRVVYTVDVANPSGASLTQVQVVDVLPPGEVYATGSGRFNGKPLEPTVSARTLTWTLPVLAAGTKDEIVYSAVIYPSVAAGTVLTNTATGSAVIGGTVVKVSAAANAEVLVTEGALSDRSVITGRVFLDNGHNGHFVKGDQGIAGVRVFMEDGTSVVTDVQGRFSFPAVRPGMHVLRVDKTTLPDGMHGGVLQRLVHGVLDDGLMQDIEFAVGPGT